MVAQRSSFGPTWGGFQRDDSSAESLKIMSLSLYQEREEGPCKQGSMSKGPET